MEEVSFSPASLLLYILEISQGRYSPSEVEYMYELVRACSEEETAPPTTAKLIPIKGGKNAERVTETTQPDGGGSK